MEEMKNNHFRLIALDMDGTALTKDKTIDSTTKEAIHQAIREGVEVVFCSGRGLTEMMPFLKDFPEMHYLIGESGAFVYDLQEKKILFQKAISIETIQRLHQLVKEDNILALTFTDGQLNLTEEKSKILPEFHLRTYEGHYDKTWRRIKAESLLSYHLEHGLGSEKINFIHRTPEEREVTMETLRNANLNLEMVYSSPSSIECSPYGLSKALGLRMLSEKVNIPLEEMVMVGDADNDLEAMRQVGCAIAMGNANDNCKRIADRIVSDNDHGGCREAILSVLDQNH